MAIALGDKLAGRAALGDRLRQGAENVAIPLLALIAAMILFGIFVALSRVNPLDLYAVMYRGAFGTWFSWQNTLTRAAPLILTALCTALPAQLGMVVIGGEGAFVIGGLAATAAALALPGAAPLVTQLAMAAAAVAAGGLWIAFVGAIRQYRGVNETISSLLLIYIAIAILNQLVEGPMRDPASLNKPSTHDIGAANMIGLDPRHRHSLGPGLRHHRRRAGLYPRLSHRVRLRRAHRRRQYARRQGGGPGASAGWCWRCASSAAPPRGLPA